MEPPKYRVRAAFFPGGWLAWVLPAAGGSHGPAAGRSVACGAGEAGTERAHVPGEFWRLVHVELEAGEDQAEGQPFQRVGVGFEPTGLPAGRGETTCGAAQLAGGFCGRGVQGDDGLVGGGEGARQCRRFDVKSARNAFPCSLLLTPTRFALQGPRRPRLPDAPSAGLADLPGRRLGEYFDRKRCCVGARSRRSGANSAA
jgi:hypothetical protein